MKIDVSIADILLISPFWSLFLISLIPITAKVLRGNQEQKSQVTLSQGLIGILISAGLLLVFAGHGKPAFGGLLIFDGLTLWMGLVALLASGLSLILMHENPATSGNQFSELVFLTLSSVLGILVLISANDLLMTFIGLETMSLALYLMIAMSHEQKLAKEAALKYFVLGSFASAVFLYGIALIFGTAETTNLIGIIEKLPQLMESSKLFLFGITFVVLGLCFKVSIFPFHAWTPDVYEGAPTPHTAFMATAVKVASFAAFLRVIAMGPLGHSENLFIILQWLAVLTMLVGNVAAILQNQMKRILAYSSIAHSGYLLIGVIAAGSSDHGAFAGSSVIFYLFSYSLMTLGAFAIINMLEKDENSKVSVDDLAGLAQRRPVLALCLTVFLLSLAGIPPSLGFFGKFYLFNAAIGEG
jgi:NADH-quinone oxidoreductase subunit N